MGNGVTHLNFLCVLDTTDNISNLASTQFLAGYHVHLQDANLVGHIFHPGVKELHFISLTDYSIGYLEIRNDTAEAVKYRVENQCLQRSLLVTNRMWNTFYNGI